MKTLNDVIGEMWTRNGKRDLHNESFGAIEEDEKLVMGLKGEYNE